MLLLSKLFKLFFGYFHPENISFDNLRGDLADISAEKEPLMVLFSGSNYMLSGYSDPTNISVYNGDKKIVEVTCPVIRLQQRHWLEFMPEHQCFFYSRTIG